MAPFEVQPDGVVKRGVVQDKVCSNAWRGSRIKEPRTLVLGVVRGITTACNPRSFNDMAGSGSRSLGRWSGLAK